MSARAEFEAGAFGGYHAFSEKNRLGRFDRDPPATAFTSSATLGFRVAYLPIPYLGGEFQMSVVPTDTQNGQSKVTVIHGRAHLMASVPFGKVRPFVLLGLGAANATPVDPVYLRNMTELNFHAGAGVRYDIDRLWGVRFDVQTIAVPRVDANGMAFEPSMLLGIYGNFPWPPAPPLPFDKDHDDITDDKDECPDSAGDIRFGGCPDPAAAPAEDAEKPEDEASDAPEPTPADSVAPEKPATPEKPADTSREKPANVPPPPKPTPQPAPTAP